MRNTRVLFFFLYLCVHINKQIEIWDLENG